MWKVAVAGLIGWACSGMALAQEAVKKPEPKTLEELDKALGEAFVAAQIPGVSVTIVENGAIVLTKGYGVSDLKTKAPVTPDTVFRAGSISKSFTSLAVMMLVEEGKLDLNAKLSDLMPELKFDNPWEATDPVRLIHLVEHTTGFDDIGFRHYLIEGKDIDLAKGVDLYGPYKSRWRPGERVSYCNAGPVIAGRILETVTGKKFQDFISERLTGPLGMPSAYWTREPQITDRISKSYKADGMTEEPFVEIVARPSGSLNVTSKDLVRFPLMMMGRGALDGVTILKPETVAQIEKAESSAGARAGLTQDYGKGVLVYAGEKTVFHGHDGGIDGFISKYEYAPSLGAAFVLMANAPKEELLDAAGTIRRYLERNASPLKSADLPVANVDKFVGQYQSIAPRQQIFAPLLGLTQWQGGAAEGTGFSFNGTKRVHLGANIFRKPDAAAPNLVLLETPDGVRMHTPTTTYRLVPRWEVWAKTSAIGVFVLSAALALLHAIVWIPSAFMGRLAERGGVTIRLFPFMALLLVALIPVGFVTLLTFGDTETLGTPSLPAYALYIVTLAAPAISAMAVLRSALSSEDASLFVRGLAWLASLSASVGAAYFAATGWFGLQVWL
jgi:CubicO group peptidase (beta-lactamase class C family)